MNTRIEHNELDIGSIITPLEDVYMQGTNAKTFTKGIEYMIVNCILGNNDKHTIFVVKNDFNELHNLPLNFIQKHFLKNNK